jgi:hypothetical protein
MGWISVKDELPEKGENVLISTRYGVGLASICSSSGNLVNWIEPYGEYTFSSVTHWMPLPEPPDL